MGQALDGVVEPGQAMGQDTAAHQEHGRGADHRQGPHQPGCPGQEQPPQAPLKPRQDPLPRPGAEPEPGVVDLDNAGHQAVDPDRHDDGNPGQHRRLGGEGRPGHGPQGDDDDLRRQHEVRQHGPADLVPLQGGQVHRRVLQGLGQLGVMPLRLRPVQELVGQLLDPLVAQVGPADHEQGQNGPGRHQADSQGRRDQDQLVAEGPLGHRPDHRQFALGAHPRHLLGIQGQVIAQDPGGLARRDLGHNRDVIEDCSDVVEQGEQAGTGHGGLPSGE